MLPDPDAQRRERVLLALRLDHHVRLSAVEGGAQRLPVPGFHRVGVRPGLLREVLAPEVYLRARSPDLPGREREVQGLLERSGEVLPIYAGALREGAFADQPWASGFRAARPVVLSTTIDGFEASVGEFRRIVLERVNEVLTAGKAPEVAMREAQQGLENLAGRI